MLHQDFSVVYSGTSVKADLLKCLLEGAGIHALLENEFVGMIALYVSPSGVGAVNVFIPNSAIGKGRSIVEDFSKQVRANDKQDFVW